MAIAMVMLFSGMAMAQMFTIHGKIDGVTSGKAELAIREGRAMNVKFSSGIRDGEFTLTGKITEPDFYYLRVGDVRGYIPLFLDNSKIEIKGASDKLAMAEVSGSKLHDQYAGLSKASQAVADKFKETIDAYNAAYQAKDEAKKKELEPAIDQYRDELNAAGMDYIKSLGSSPVAAYLLSQRVNQMDDPKEIEALASVFGEDMKDNKYLKTVLEIIPKKKITAIGEIAPDFTQNDVNGNPVSLSDFRGKYVLVDFWAAWCGPCRGENPNVVEAYKKFNKKGFTVLGVSLDQKKEDWLKAIEDDGLTWTHVSDLKYWDNEVALQYWIRSIPANLLLDKKGKIIAKNLRGEDLHTELKKILK